VPEPEPPESFRLKVPLVGSLYVTGRDVMLMALLTAVGSGLIGMQLYTFRSFQYEMASQVAVLTVHIAKGQEDRDRILALLRLRICSDLPSPPPHLEDAWKKACTN
jgi:hypothetical protein